MSLLLISQAYSFSDDEDVNSANSAASTEEKKNNENLEDSGSNLKSTVNLKCRTSSRLAKQLKNENQRETAEKLENLELMKENVPFKETNDTDRSDLKNTRKNEAEYSGRLNNLSQKPLEKDTADLKFKDKVFTTSFLDLLEAKIPKKTANQPTKETSREKKNLLDHNRQKTQMKEVLKKQKSQNRKSLAANQCIMCHKQFDCFKNLQRHILGHIGEKPLSCNVCNASFARLSNLKSHKLIHTGEKPYKCMTCHKTFRQSSVLKAHEIIHTGEKPFQCSFCNASFNHQSTLTSHKRIHTGEKPYQCTICSKCFAEFTTWKRHERVHTREKPFECLSCGISFSRRDALNRHAKKHSKINH